MCHSATIMQTMNAPESLQHFSASVTRRGQVTIPVEVRRLLGIKARGRVAFIVDPKGTVRIAVPQYPDIASLRGAAGTLSAPMDWKKMQEIAHTDRLEANYSKST